MATKKRKTARRRAPAKVKARCCMCPTTQARSVLRQAKMEAARSGSCGVVSRAFQNFEAAAYKEAPTLPRGQQALLRRELTTKRIDVNRFCTKLEQKQSAQFNGVLGLGLFGIL